MCANNKGVQKYAENVHAPEKVDKLDLIVSLCFVTNEPWDHVFIRLYQLVQI